MTDLFVPPVSGCKIGKVVNDTDLNENVNAVILVCSTAQRFVNELCYSPHTKIFGSQAVTVVRTPKFAMLCH